MAEDLSHVCIIHNILLKEETHGVAHPLVLFFYYHVIPILLGWRSFNRLVFVEIIHASILTATSFACMQVSEIICRVLHLYVHELASKDKL